MSKYLHTIVVFLFLSFGMDWIVSAQSVEVECGSWISLTATPVEGYRFLSWNDGDTMAIRQIQVNEDAQYIAYFTEDCESYHSLPVVALYDWLIMLNIDSIQRAGFYFTEDNVWWYRVVGEPDSMGESFPDDDQLMCKGYYLTLDHNLGNTGDYYAVVDISSSPAGMLCGDYMRSVLIRYSGGSAQRSPVHLHPSGAAPGQSLRLSGLDPEQEYFIVVYDMAGHRLRQFSTSGQAEYILRAEMTPGCYNVWVQNEEEHHVVRYIVHTN